MSSVLLAGLGCQQGFTSCYGTRSPRGSFRNLEFTGLRGLSVLTHRCSQPMTEHRAPTPGQPPAALPTASDRRVSGAVSSVVTGTCPYPESTTPASAGRG